MEELHQFLVDQVEDCKKRKAGFMAEYIAAAPEADTEVLAAIIVEIGISISTLEKAIKIYRQKLQS